jgi:signal transduction histidine kinase
VAGLSGEHTRALAPPLNSATATETRAVADGERSARLRRVCQELAVRSVVGTLILAVNEILGIGPNAPGDASLRGLALAAVLLNGPYYLIAHTEWRPRLQAYVRMLVDVTFLTAGLYDAGGLAAAQDLAVYVIIPVYAALMFSSMAAVVATIYATVSFLAVVLGQHLGLLAMPRPPLPQAWAIVVFNLLIVNLVGVLTAWLAERYRRSRREIATLNRELERAHDASLRLAGEIQRTARLHALGEVVVGVTHEMRNALSAAVSHARVLRSKLGEADGEKARHADQIERALAGAVRILNNVLEAARQPSNERVRVSIPDVVRRVVDLKGYDVRRDGIVLRVEFPLTFPAVIAVPFQLEQVLLNLVSNAHDALRAAGGSGTIVIAGVFERGQAVTEVRDSGPGIPEDVLPRIFEPFYTTKRHGTGLGLAISAGIVRDSGGELTAANRPGGGAVFRLVLPIAP